MSLGLPSHLARVTISVAFQKSLHAVAFAASLCSAFTVVAFMAAYPARALWPALVAVVFLSVALWLIDRFESFLFDVTYVVVGAAAVYWYTTTLLTQLPEVVTSGSPWLVLPKVAVVMVAGIGVSAWASLGWCLLGYVTATFFGFTATVQSGVEPTFDTYTGASTLIVLVAIGLSVIGRVRARKSQPQLHRAAREERMSAVRSGMELKAAALLHDTVLSHLAAIANAPGEQLNPQLKKQIRRDLDLIVGEEWLREAEPVPSATGVDWRTSPLMAAIHESSEQGLEIVGTGDMAAVIRLDRARSIALGLAVKQCLTNVIKHSGVMAAEVAVYGSDTEVSVMVVDSGCGFELSSVGADRLGLKASIRRRIENAGGTVRLWSTPGSGSSVLIRVPVAAPTETTREPSAQNSEDETELPFIAARQAEEPQLNQAGESR